MNVQTTPIEPLKIQKMYNQNLKNGTILETEISLTFKNFNAKDIEDLRTGFADYCHNFYFKLANELNKNMEQG